MWDTHTQNLIKQVEAVQNRAARFMSGVNYKKCRITQVKKDLNWDDLVTWRKVVCLVNFHQAIGGHLAIAARTILRPVQRSTRLTSPTTNNFTPIQASKDCYKQSFLPRTVIDWNQLPKSITSIEDKQQFNSAINSHFKIYLIKDQETQVTNNSIHAHTEPCSIDLHWGEGCWAVSTKTRQDKRAWILSLTWRTMISKSGSDNILLFLLTCKEVAIDPGAGE